MTNQITIEGRLASFEADGPLVAGNTYPVAVSYDSEWSGSVYLRVRFGSLYYDIPMTIADGASTADVQMPVGYPEVGLGVYSEALEICTNEARTRLLRSILEAGAEVVDFDGDLYDQWAGEVTALVTDDEFDAESTRPVQNAVLTAWKGQVEGGAMTIGGAKSFTSPVGVGSPTGPGHAVDMATLSGKLADGSVTKVGTADVGTDAKPVKIVAGVPTAVGANLATDSAVVHKTGDETVAGNKTLTSSFSLSMITPAVYLRSGRNTATGPRANLAVKDQYGGQEVDFGEDRWGSSNGYNYRTLAVKAPDRASEKTLDIRVYADRQEVLITPYYPVNADEEPVALGTDLLMASGNIAVDPRIVHTTGTETIAGNKTLTGNVVNANSLDDRTVSVKGWTDASTNWWPIYRMGLLSHLRSTVVNLIDVNANKFARIYVGGYSTNLICVRISGALDLGRVKLARKGTAVKLLVSTTTSANRIQGWCEHDLQSIDSTPHPSSPVWVAETDPVAVAEPVVGPDWDGVADMTEASR